ncbi:beta-propeller domain-containing protein [Patescibacteria group bacterium]|nr:beta-propeller domain-containing protein [Patescibacteria group bacterium]
MAMKKMFAGMLTLALLMGAFVSFGTASAESVSFADVDASYEYSDAIYYLQDEGTIEGYEDDTYRPDNIINRAEFTKITLIERGEIPEGGNCFPDVTDQWFAPYVCKAKDLGLVQGYPDGTFKPERPINFVESGKVVTEGLKLAKDDALNAEWYEKYVKALEAEEAIPQTVGTFDHYINRGEMAEIMWRVQTDQNLSTGNYEDLKEETEAQLVHTVNSCNELKEKFEADNDYYRSFYEDDIVMMALPEATMDTATKTAGAVAEESEGSAEYSTTNVQVEGVDEADIVKTDGKYIYVVKGDTVRVIDAYLPDKMRELDAVTFGDENFHPEEMYVDGDKLVVIGGSYYAYPYPLRDNLGIARYPYYGGSLSKVYIFDISDKTNIIEFRTLEFEGDYSQSRKVDDMVYVVFNRYAFYAFDDILEADEIMPRYKDGEEESEPICGCGDVKYIPNIESSNYMIVVGIPINDKDAKIQKEVMLGTSENIYSSRDNLYVASTSWSYRSSNTSTNVYKFALNDNDIEYVSKGRVPGTILNQFSMDEYDGYFRIATTQGNSWDGTSRNNVYTLDGDMNIAGKLEGIAPGESIYSMRFMGDRGYMVTFKKIDPFFVLDLSNPNYPTILGKLKIPGYSDYLHPYDENHIIGFGKDTVIPSELDAESRSIDFEWYQGMKIAMFDVTDVENPVQLHTEIIGDRGTDSPLLSDHKALMFDKEKGLMAFPVMVYELADEYKALDYTGDIYGEPVYQGVYVYDISIENGFQLRGRVSHYAEDEIENKAGYYWYGDFDIERALYIGNYLYTVSMGMIKANNLNDLVEVNSVELGGESDDYYYIME